jgi:hypothetical protein
MMTEAKELPDGMKEIRECGNCACFFKGEHKDFYCRRTPADAQMVRVSVPRLRNGKEDIDSKTGQPIMIEQQQMALVYKPTLPNLVCFDGWRPADTKPGDKSVESIGSLMEQALQGYRKLWADLQNETVDGLQSLADGTKKN